MSSSIKISSSDAKACVDAFNRLEPWVTIGCRYHKRPDLTEAFQNLRSSYAKHKVSTQLSAAEREVISYLDGITGYVIDSELTYIATEVGKALLDGRLTSGVDTNAAFISTFEKEAGRKRSKATWEELKSSLAGQRDHNFIRKLATLTRAVLPHKDQVKSVGEALTWNLNYLNTLDLSQPAHEALLDSITEPVIESAKASLRERADTLRAAIATATS